MSKIFPDEIIIHRGCCAILKVKTKTPKAKSKQKHTHVEC